MDLPKGMRRHGGGIEVRFQHRRRPYSKTLDVPPTPAGVAQAARYLEAWKAHVKFGTPHPDVDQDEVPASLLATDSPRFDEVAQHYLDTTEIRKSSRNTYRDLLNTYWNPRLGDRPVASITGKLLRELDRETAWPSKLYRKNAITALRQVFEHAIDEEVLEENPAAGLRVRRIQKNSEPDPFTKEERAAILRWVEAHAPPHGRLAVEIAFGTGMRTGEILALRAEDWDGEAISVRRSRVRGDIVDTKTSETRRVRVDTRLRRILDARVAELGAGGGWLLVTGAGDPYLYPGKAFRWYRAALEELGLRKRTGPYPWRHTYASIGLSTPGVSPKWLANQLGHSLSMFERVYARWIESRSDEVQMARLEAGWTDVELDAQERGASERSSGSSASESCS